MLPSAFSSSHSGCFRANSVPGIRGQRRPPQLGLETFGVNLVDEGPHIGIAVWKLLWLQEPITLRSLPSVVQRDPGEAELFHDRKRAIDLARRELPAVSPSAPDGTECAIGRSVKMNALRNHHFAVIAQGLKIVAFVNGGEGAKCFQRRTRLQHLILLELHCHCGAIGTLLRHRQRNQLGRHFQMPHADTAIPLPNIDNRSAATIVRRVHAQKILLLETRLQRQYPVRPLLVGAALIRPERRLSGRNRSADRIMLVGPAAHRQIRTSRVGVGDFEEWPCAETRRTW